MSIFTIRAHKRFAVCHKVRLGKPKRRGLDGLLIELSLDGCRISHASTPARFVLEDDVLLDVGGAAPIAARVRWLNDGVIGLRFTTPLHNIGLESLIRLCRGQADPQRAYGT